MLKVGDHFAGCRVAGLCGTGAYGSVYAVEDALGRRLALKVYSRAILIESSAG